MIRDNKPYCDVCKNKMIALTIEQAEQAERDGEPCGWDNWKTAHAHGSPCLIYESQNSTLTM